MDNTQTSKIYKNRTPSKKSVIAFLLIGLQSYTCKRLCIREHKTVRGSAGEPCSGTILKTTKLAGADAEA